MRRFAELFRQLDRTNSTNAKIAALVRYFHSAPPRDAIWAVYVLSGRRLKRLIKANELREWASDVASLPLWLFEETYQHVGDLAETVALLVPEHSGGEQRAITLADWMTSELPKLRQISDHDDRKSLVTSWWQQVEATERFLLVKLMTGAFRIGVSKRLVTRALAQTAAIDSAEVAHKLMGNWEPTEKYFAHLLDPNSQGASDAQMYPFYLASPMDGEIAELGDASQWQAEWKWDGIRAQLVKRNGNVFIWSRGEELMENRFPEIEEAAVDLPDGTVLDGEILAWPSVAENPLPFGQLQRRIGRKKPGPKLLSQVPLKFLAYDLLELDAVDMRGEALQKRQIQLSSLLSQMPGEIATYPPVAFDRWEQLTKLRDTARDRGVEGFILKRLDSPYRVGRKRGDWWKWKTDPLTIDAVLLYAQPGHGRRANLYTDYTFAVWEDDALIPVAKAYSGLTDKEILKLDRWIRRNTKERFGPVRSVTPEHVFELAFEGINASPRHKSGIALRFPRIHRWRDDLALQDADSLADLKKFLL